MERPLVTITRTPVGSARFGVAVALARLLFGVVLVVREGSTLPYVVLALAAVALVVHLLRLRRALTVRRAGAAGDGS